MPPLLFDISFNANFEESSCEEHCSLLFTAQRAGQEVAMPLIESGTADSKLENMAASRDCQGLGRLIAIRKILPSCDH